jgi:2-phospho-L-lactate guanylyltransferase (CobY/MobA/RfbA family)
MAICIEKGGGKVTASLHSPWDIRPLPPLFHTRILDTSRWTTYPDEEIVEGIARSLMAEGVLTRENKKGRIVGAYLGNRLDAIANKTYDSVCWFFCNPCKTDRELLYDYMRFFASPGKKLSIGWILTDFLQNRYPLGSYVLMKFVKNIDSNSLITDKYDENERVLEITVKDVGYRVIGDVHLEDSEVVFPPLEKEKTKAFKLPPLKVPLNLSNEIKKSDPGIKNPLSTILQAYSSSPQYKDHAEDFLKRMLILAGQLRKKVGKGNKRDSCAVGLPVKGFMHDKPVLFGILWLVYDRPWSEIKEEEELIIHSLLSNILYPFAGKLQTILLSLATRKRLEAEERSATSAIMSRNMSHHIGSHVIPRTTLDALKKRLVEFFFNERSLDTRKEWSMLYDMVSDLKGTMDDYVRRKAEFIAEATTGPVLSTRSARFFQEVVLPFMRNTALIDTLAANEGFGYSAFDSSSLVIRCFRKKGGEVIREFVPRFRDTVYGDEVKIGNEAFSIVPYAERNSDDRTTALIPVCKEERMDVRVALPGPVGEMAFYGILENIIRNAAKHSSDQKGRDKANILEVHIVICDSSEDSDHYSVKIYENLTNPNQERDWKQDGQDTSGTLVKMLHHYIQASIIEEQGQLRKKAWGIAEMDISASLLNGWSEFKQKSLQVKVGLPAKTFATSDSPSKCLIYTMRMMKARTALLIGFNDPQNKNELAKAGFAFVEKPVELLKSKENLEKENLEKTSASFQFAVISADALLKEGNGNYLLDKIRHHLPFRIIIAGANTTHNPFSECHCYKSTDEIPPMNKGADTLLKWLWKTWLGYWKTAIGANDSNYGVDLYLGLESDIEPTKSWIERADKFNKECDKMYQPYGMRIWGEESVRQFTAWEKPQSNRRLILDRHGLFAQHSSKPPRDKDCYVVIDKSNADFDTVFNPSFSDPFILPYELIEAGLLKILVLDERIAQKAMDSLSGTEGTRDAVVYALLGSNNFSPTLWHLAARANVFVVTHLNVLGIPAEQDGKDPFKLNLAENVYNKRHDAFLKETKDKRRSSARIKSCPSLKLTVDIAKDKDAVDMVIKRVGPRLEKSNFTDSRPLCHVKDLNRASPDDNSLAGN